VGSTSQILHITGLTFEEKHVLSEHFLAFFAGEHHIGGFLQFMVALFVVAVGAVIPLLAARGPNSSLNIENVLAH